MSRALTILLVIGVLLSHSLPAQEKMMIIVNPIAGNGQANKYYQEQVKPALSKKYALVEKDIAHVSDDPDLMSFKGIIGVGGDGTIHEIFKALERSKHSKEAIAKIAIGHIPKGSGNALARSIYQQTCGDEQYSAEAIVEGLIKGETLPLDLWSYESDKQHRGIFFLSISYGLVSDIDIGSEWLRPYFGSWRFDLYATYQWLRNREYDYELTFALDGKMRHSASKTREIWVMNMPYASESVRVAPLATLGDGKLHIMRIDSQTSLAQAFTFLTSLNSGVVHKLPFVRIEKADALELQTNGKDRVAVDGELLSPAIAKISVKKFPVKAKVFRASCAANSHSHEEF